jgi:hypothetical protein
LNDLEKVEIGDEIYQRSGVSYSVFKIDEILEIRKGAVSGMNYITAKSSWEIRDNL